MRELRVKQECEQKNLDRNVRNGKVCQDTLLRNVRGNMLISGRYAKELSLWEKIIQVYLERNDMPTIVLTGTKEVLERTLSRPGVVISGGGRKNYHPMYGMNKQQIWKLIQSAAEETGGNGTFQKMHLYAMAALDIVSAQYPVSLPALIGLMECEDEYIVQFALEKGVSERIVNTIYGNREGGILFRRVLEHLQRTFEGIALRNSETKYNMVAGAERGNLVMLLDQYSQNQRLFNSYLREELYALLQRNSKVRVILGEVFFVSKEDELLQFLMQMKRQGKVEVIICSEYAQEIVYGEQMEFENICLFMHGTTAATENLSEAVFGKYIHYYPSVSVGRPPALLFSFRRDERWSSQQEERLRVRAVDLNGKREELLAIKLWNYRDVYLVPVNDFFEGR